MAEQPVSEAPSLMEGFHEIYQQDTDLLLEALKVRDEFHVNKVKEALEDSLKRYTQSVLTQLPQNVLAGLQSTIVSITPSVVGQFEVDLARRAECVAEEKYLEVGRKEFAKDFRAAKELEETENIVVKHRKAALEEVVSRLEDKKALLIGRKREVERVKSEYDLSLAQIRLTLDAEMEYVQELHESSELQKRKLRDEIQALEEELNVVVAKNQVMDIRLDELTAELASAHIATKKHLDTLQNEAYGLTLKFRELGKLCSGMETDTRSLREKTRDVGQARQRLTALRWLYRAQFREQREAQLADLEEMCEPLIMEMNDFNADIPPLLPEPLPEVDIPPERPNVRVRRLMESEDDSCVIPDVEERWALREDGAEKDLIDEEEEEAKKRFSTMVPDAGEPGRPPASPIAARIIYCTSNHAKVKWNLRYVPRNPLSIFDDVINTSLPAHTVNNGDGCPIPDPSQPQSTASLLAPLRYSVVLRPLSESGAVTPKITSERFISLTGLESETEYEVAITSVSRFGSSEPALMTFKTPPAAQHYRKPPRPTNLTHFTEGTQTTLSLLQPRSKPSASSLHISAPPKKLDPVVKKPDISKFQRMITVDPPTVPKPVFHVTDEDVLDEAMNTMDILLRER